MLEPRRGRGRGPQTHRTGGHGLGRPTWGLHPPDAAATKEKWGQRGALPAWAWTTLGPASQTQAHSAPQRGQERPLGSRVGFGDLHAHVQSCAWPTPVGSPHLPHGTRPSQGLPTSRSAPQTGTARAIWPPSDQLLVLNGSGPLALHVSTDRCLQAGHEATRPSRATPAPPTPMTTQ